MLLDTHVWVWMVGDVPRQLGPRVRRRLLRAAGSGALCVSAASAFEITALHTAGRLRLTQPVERWIQESVERAGLRMLSVDHRIAIDAGSTPATALPDPLDRLLVATAREHGIALVTRDAVILDYARRTRLVDVVEASA